MYFVPCLPEIPWFTRSALRIDPVRPIIALEQSIVRGSLAAGCKRTPHVLECPAIVAALMRLQPARIGERSVVPSIRRPTEDAE
jgi:hypothetical protein